MRTFERLQLQAVVIEVFKYFCKYFYVLVNAAQFSIRLEHCEVTYFSHHRSLLPLKIHHCSKGSMFCFLSICFLYYLCFCLYTFRWKICFCNVSRTLSLQLKRASRPRRDIAEGYLIYLGYLSVWLRIKEYFLSSTMRYYCFNRQSVSLSQQPWSTQIPW